MLSTGFELIGNYPKFRKSLEMAKNVAVTKTPVLINGELGSGKRSLAQYIHEHSARKSAPFSVVECGEDLESIERRVLGFRDEESGRFNKGVLEECNGGTVVFADIDELDESFQKRLYNIIQELPDYEIDVRIIATTSKNLSKLVGAGKFFRALLSYFSGAQISIVPLRERGSDVELIARSLISRHCQNNQIDMIDIAPEAIQRLNDFTWNQNITELNRLIHHALNNLSNGIIDLSSFEQGEKKGELTESEFDQDGVRLMSLREAEKLLIKKALVFTSENRTQAAKILGVSIRTLRNKINEYRVEGTQYFVNLR